MTSRHFCNNNYLFYLKFLSCTVLTLAIFGVNVNHSVAQKTPITFDISSDESDDSFDPFLSTDAPKKTRQYRIDTNFSSAVSTFSISYLCFRPTKSSQNVHWLDVIGTRLV